MKLFVYGTLKRGQPAHGLLRGAALVARACTEPRYSLVDMGGYPAMVEGGDIAIIGEIYEVDADTLAELDRYEEAPELYWRVELQVAGHRAWVYLLPSMHASDRPRLQSGDWVSSAGPDAVGVRRRS